METIVQLDRLDYAGDRVREHTAAIVNSRIDTSTRSSIDDTIAHGRDAVVRRLSELDHEWDIDRALFVNFAVIGAFTFSTGLYRFLSRPAGVFFGKRRKGLLGLFGVQMAWQLIHGVIGWCPPVSVFRRLGFRTQREIESERHALQTALASG